MISLPHQDADTVTHFAIDIGGSLIKVIYFTSSDDGDDAYAKQAGPRLKPTSASGGRLHFVKFETAQLHEAIDFIRSKGLHRQHNGDGTPNGKVARVRFFLHLLNGSSFCDNCRERMFFIEKNIVHL